VPHDKMELCKALLSIGDIKNAEILILKFEGICSRYPEIATRIYRLCDTIMDPAYKLYMPPSIVKRDEELARRGELSALIANRRLHSKVPASSTEFPDPNIELTFNIEEDNLYHQKKRNTKIKFFFGEWADQLDKCTSHQHIIDKLMPTMRLAGYNNHLDQRFVKRLMALGRSLLTRVSIKERQSDVWWTNIGSNVRSFVSRKRKFLESKCNGSILPENAFYQLCP